ncbi:MAG TPA: hypothetical protein VN857_13115 [Chthoniobacterales bacterium]|jgi:hypothetical protein|nr:hypothetical protein [Chthoniobacterales bacterium]
MTAEQLKELMAYCESVGLSWDDYKNMLWREQQLRDEGFTEEQASEIMNKEGFFDDPPDEQRRR